MIPQPSDPSDKPDLADLSDKRHSISRRGFLRKSGLALSLGPAIASSCLCPSARSRAASVGANDKIRIGLIGSGARGRDVLGVFLSNKEVDCPVVCDVDDRMLVRAVAEVEDKRGTTPDTVKDFRRVLDRKDIDCVLVATPDHWHALPTVMAFEAGKDVYVEKPLAKTIDEGRVMAEAAKKHKRVAQMGTQWRSSAHFKEAIDFVKSGKLGKIGLARGWVYWDYVQNLGRPADRPAPAGVDYDFWLGPAPKHAFNPNRFHFNFRFFWDYAGGLMTDWGVHLINVLLWGMGQDHPKTIVSTGGKFNSDDDRETPDTQVTTYEFPNYMMLWEHRMGSNNGPYNDNWGMLFNGVEGTVLISESGWEVIPERKRQGVQAQKRPAGPDERFPHVRNFLDCLRNREQPVENLDVGHHAPLVAHLGNEA